MKKTISILMLMTVILASAVFAVSPVDITNPSFEDATGGECDFWTLFFGGGAAEPVYHEGDSANANNGSDYFEVGNGGAGWSGIHTDFGQEVAVTPGTDVEMIMFAKTADGTTQTDSVIMKLEFYYAQGESWLPQTLFVEQSCDTTGSYQMLSLVTEVPAGINYARATIVSTGTAVYVDDVWVGPTWNPPPPPWLPSPANGSIQSVKNAPSYGYTPVTALSWTNPPPLNGTDPLTVDVKFEREPGGVFDPNWTNPSTASGIDIETITLSSMTNPPTLPLPDDSLYSWQVTVDDPNTSYGGGHVITESNVWTFETGDAKPIIQAPADQYMWIDQEDGDGDPTIRTFTVTTTYTDDGKSAIVDANFTTPNWLWENGYPGVIEVSDVHTPDAPDASGAQSGTVVATYKTVALGDDPARPTEETTIPGWWNMILEVTDATDRTTTGNYGFNYIAENCGDAAAAGGDLAFEASDGAYDVNDDCIINIVDFAALAAKWLDQSSKYE